MTTLVEFMILSGADNRPPMLDKDLTKKYKELSATEKIQVDCDIKTTNIILQGLPSNIYSLVNHHRVAKELWERIQLLMQGTSLTKQERECKLYAAFDKFAHIKGESLHQYYLRFTQLINDMNIYKMKLEQFQLNAYLEQHELYANEVRILREQSQHLSVFIQQSSVPTTVFTILVSSIWINSSHTTLLNYLSIYTSCNYLSVSIGDDPIDAINKMMSFPSTVVTSRFPSTNNQGRKSSFAAGTSGTRANILGTGVNNSGQQRVVKCFNCQGEGHMARQCLKPKRKRDATWFRDKVLLVEAQ
ncbi:integrase, catalytic region, zinc finger, CCHC-type containing protein [Tanacetum coccineum]